MKSINLRIALLGVFLFFAPSVWAQTPAAANQSAAAPAPSAAAAEVPRLIKFSGTLLDALDRPLAGPVGVTFALHAQQTGGAALWMETQNVTPDAHGLYTVLLGANSAHGVPAELFASGEARWLEVQVEREAEQPRILLVSVPYALKAADADTLGGKPLSAFVTTGQAAGGSASASGKSSASAGVVVPAVSGTGNTNVVAKWVDNLGTLGNSQITDDGSNVNMTGNAGALTYKFTGNAALPTNPTATILNAANIGPVFSGLSFKVRTGSPAPADALSIDPSHNVSIAGNASALTYKFTGNAALPTDATATILNAAGVGPVFSGLSFRVRTGAPAPADALTGTTAPSANLEVNGTAKFDGLATFAAGQTLTGTETISGNLALPNTSSGSVGVVTLGGTSFLHNFGTNNTFVGSSAGNMTMTGSINTEVGASALSHNTMGSDNNAFGFNALTANTTGFLNSAFGDSARAGNTTGVGNSAFGHQALFVNTTGFNNNAFGSTALASNTTGTSNSAFGASALLHNTTGGLNAAFGTSALQANSTGGSNSAFGADSLFTNTIGFNNSAFGASALFANTTGGDNAAFGTDALDNNTMGGGNSAFGLDALFANTTGSNNVAFGASTLQSLTSGNGNIAIGASAGVNLSTGSSNIYIGNFGAASESNTIRIGTAGTQAAAFMAGISGATSASGVAVLVNSSGQLGTTLSSRRFKNEIADIAAESDLLMKLRPVAFYYKPELDETQTRQYGLVAEEVAQVAPQLVVFDKDGAPQTVRYHFVNAMLLNEVQKQRQLVEEQQSTIARQQAEIQDLAARLAKLEALVAPVR